MKMKCWVGDSIFFHRSFSKIMLSILFTWRKVKIHAVFDRKNNAALIRIIQEN